MFSIKNNAFKVGFGVGVGYLWINAFEHFLSNLRLIIAAVLWDLPFLIFLVHNASCSPLVIFKYRSQSIT